MNTTILARHSMSPIATTHPRQPEPLDADIRALLNQTQDPAVYRTALASLHGVRVHIVDAAITRAGWASLKRSPAVP